MTRAGPLSVSTSVSRGALVTLNAPTAPDEATGWVDYGGLHATGIHHAGQTTWEFRHGAGGAALGMMGVPVVGKVVPTNQAAKPKPTVKKAPAVQRGHLDNPTDAFRHGVGGTGYGQRVSSGMHRVHLDNPTDTFRHGSGGQALGNDESMHWYGVMPNRMVN